MSDNEPVAWAVALGDEGMVLDGIYISRAKADEVLEWRKENTNYGARLIPLYRQPTLTDADREAIEWALEEGVWSYGDPEDWTKAERLRAFLRGLLERAQ
jgi:hypothetical protein